MESVVKEIARLEKELKDMKTAQAIGSLSVKPIESETANQWDAPNRTLPPDNAGARKTFNVHVEPVNQNTQAMFGQLIVLTNPLNPSGVNTRFSYEVSLGYSSSALGLDFAVSTAAKGANSYGPVSFKFKFIGTAKATITFTEQG